MKKGLFITLVISIILSTTVFATATASSKKQTNYKYKPIQSNSYNKPANNIGAYGKMYGNHRPPMPPYGNMYGNHKPPMSPYGNMYGINKPVTLPLYDTSRPVVF